MDIFSKVKKEYSFLSGARVLVAISGGVDSVCLALILKEMCAEVVLAHCNFGLRAEESEGDEVFVREFAKEQGLALEVVRFNTKEYTKESGLNTQLAARKLRYEWFETLCQRLGISYIAIGHNLNDNVETFIINLSRGTGLKGLVGIPRQSGKIVRPLSEVSRTEILAYVQECGQGWREDSSNGTDKYIRNKIRHKISPVLAELHPKFHKNFISTQNILRETQAFLEYEVGKMKERATTCDSFGTRINTEEIARHPNGLFILYMMVREFGFCNLTDLAHLMDAHSGKFLLAGAYKLVKGRGELIIQDGQGQSKANEEEVLAKVFPLIDKSKVEMPLVVRHWQVGDYFCPQGMGGKGKKLSKFFKDEKYSLPQKEAQLLVVDAKGRIVWVVDKRLDERFAK